MITSRPVDGVRMRKRWRATRRHSTSGMRVLIFHGYLLRGTGSNVYNARLAAALARLGHDVELVCQDRDPAAAGLSDLGPGTVSVHVPDIGRLLPVYVADRY